MDKIEKIGRKNIGEFEHINHSLKLSDKKSNEALDAALTSMKNVEALKIKVSSIEYSSNKGNKVLANEMKIIRTAQRLIWGMSMIIIGCMALILIILYYVLTSI